MALTQEQIDKVIEIERHTYDNLREIQLAKAPTKYNLNLHPIEKYYYNGQEYTVYDGYGGLYRVIDFPMYPAANKKSMFIKTLKEAVNLNLVYPIIIFKIIDGIRYAISYDDIIIIKNYNNTYLIIDNKDATIRYEYEAIKIPCNISYIKDPNYDIQKGYMFTEDGKLTQSYKNASFGIEFKTRYYDKYVFDNSDISVAGFRFPLTPDRRIFLDNMIVLYNDNVYLDASEYLIECDNNVFKFKSAIDSRKCKIIAYYYNIANESVDIIYKLPDPTLIEFGNEDINGIAPDYYQDLKVPLKLSSDAKDFETMIQDKYNQILEYDSSLLGNNKVGTGNNRFDKFISNTYTGKELNDIIPSTGVFVITRLPWIDPDDNTITGLSIIMIFINHKLYEKINTLMYFGGSNKAQISFNDKFADDDEIEIVHIMGYKEKKKDIVINSSSDKIYNSGYFKLDNCNLFLKEPNPISYPSSIEDATDNMNHAIEFTYNRVDDKYSNVIFEEESLYGSNIVIVPKALYAYQRITADNSDNIISGTLSDSFKYCNYSNHYMIFFNGERIPANMFSIAYSDIHNPVYDISLYITKEINRDDYIDIYYLPFDTTDLISADVIPTNGIITIDEGELPCELNRSNYFFFINGRKVPYNKINAISTGKIKIITDMENTNNLSVIYVGNNDMQKVLADDLWNKILGNLSIDELNEITGINVGITMTDDGTNIYDDSYTKESVVFEIINKYYIKYNTGFPMSYVGDRCVLQETDTDGNYIIRLLDGNNDNRVNLNK